MNIQTNCTHYIVSRQNETRCENGYFYLKPVAFCKECNENVKSYQLAGLNGGRSTYYSKSQISNLFGVKA